MRIDNDQILRRHTPLVDATGCHQQLQRLPLLHEAEVPTGPIAPAPPVNRCHRRRQLHGQ